MKITRQEARRRLKVALDDPQILGQPVTKELCDLVEAAFLPNFDRAPKAAPEPVTAPAPASTPLGKGAKPRAAQSTDKPPFNREEYQRNYIREYMRKRRAKAKA